MIILLDCALRREDKTFFPPTEIIPFKFEYNSNIVPVAQWLEHCVSSAKVVGSIPREHILMKKMYSLNKSLWIKASAKCINVILNVFLTALA